MSNSPFEWGLMAGSDSANDGKKRQNPYKYGSRDYNDWRKEFYHGYYSEKHGQCKGSPIANKKVKQAIARDKKKGINYKNKGPCRGCKTKYKYPSYCKQCYNNPY